MDIGRILLHLISCMEPLVPMMIFCAAVTCVIAVLLNVFATGVWFNEPRFRLYGIFYGLSGYDCYRLALSWTRLLMTVYYVVTVRELETAGFVAYLMVGVLYIFDVKKPKRIVKNLLWMLIVSAGLFAVDLVGGYIHTLVKFDVKAWVIYVFMGVFMCLFAYYLFLQELEDISSDRKLKPEKEYERTIKEN